MTDSEELYDVLIIGAGLSGVSAAYHLQTMCPGKRYAILEAREAIGGTWDLFRYPGIRSDSDMFTLGYSFRPWPAAKAIADGPSIRQYVEDTAKAYGVTEHIRFGRKVLRYDWSSEEGLWRVTAEGDDVREVWRARFVISCAGYYRFDEGYTPEFACRDKFAGDIIHPQHWPEDYNYAGKRIVVIGSGATAVTLVPALTDKAAHVTMLQRSPTYYFAMPGTSALAHFLRRIMPHGWAYRLMRWQRVVLQQISYRLIRRTPEKSAKSLIKMAEDRLPEGYDVATHFTPRYKPWDQRLCVVPDDDLFDAIAKGSASVVTDEIESFTEEGVLLKSGRELKADLVVTATGLALQLFGGAEISVDDAPVRPGDIFTYKGAMFDGVPNFVSIFGYTNASWTLRADLTNAYACRLINHMDEHGYATVTPVNDDPSMGREPFLDFSSGYVTRAVDNLPKQGTREPWRHPQNFFRDLRAMRYGRLEDGVLRFEKGSGAAEEPKKETRGVEAA